MRQGWNRFLTGFLATMLIAGFFAVPGAAAQTTAADYTLTLADTEFSTSDTIRVTWENKVDTFTRDWIGLYRPGTAGTSYLQWTWIDSRTGTYSIKISEPGTYEFRYFLGSGYTELTRSERFVVSATHGGGGNNDDVYTLTLSDTEITAGETISLRWENEATVFSRDWVGLYRTGAAATSYLRWAWVNTRTGTFSVPVFEPGTYEFRYFLGSGYTELARSERFVVSATHGGGGDSNTAYTLQTDRTTYQPGETARVSWSAPSRSNTNLDWIGLYRPGAANTAYLRYEYVDRLSNTETFKLTTSGTYEFRYFKNNSYRRVATSNPITVGTTATACTLETDAITNFPPGNGPIIALGDSITVGVGASAGQDYVSELENRLDTEIRNAGVSGDTTREVLARLNTDVLSRDPATVIVFIGGNDEIRRFYEELSNNAIDRELKEDLDRLAARIGYDWESVPLITRAETFANIQEIVERIQDTGATVVLVGFDATIFNPDIADAYEEIARDTGSFFIPDIYDNIFGRPSRMSDLVHPNNRGYDIIASRIAPALACNL